MVLHILKGIDGNNLAPNDVNTHKVTSLFKENLIFFILNLRLHLADIFNVTQIKLLTIRLTWK